MSSPKTKATAISSMFTSALGASLDEDDPGAVHIEENDAGLRVSAPVPAALTEAALLNLFAFLLRTADRFGHSVQHNGTSVIWAEIETTDDGGEAP